MGSDAERALFRATAARKARAGNVVIARRCVVHVTIDVASLGFPATGPGTGTAAGEDPDRGAIEAALARHDGVLAQAAADLGLSRQALYRRLDRLGIRRD